MEAFFAGSVFCPAQVVAMTTQAVKDSNFTGQTAEVKAVPAKPALVRQGSSLFVGEEEGKLALRHMDSLLLR